MKGTVLVLVAVAAAAVLLNRNKPVRGRTASGVDVLLPSPSSGLVQGVDYVLDPDTGSVTILRQGCGCHAAPRRLLLRHSGPAVYSTPLEQSGTPRNYYDTNQGVPGGGIATVFQNRQENIWAMGPGRGVYQRQDIWQRPAPQGLRWDKTAQESRNPRDPMGGKSLFNGQTRL